MPAIRATYEGRWDPARNLFAGTFTQNGTPLPLDLARGAGQAQPTVPGLDGSWETRIERNGVQLRLILRVATSALGTIASARFARHDDERAGRDRPGARGAGGALRRAGGRILLPADAERGRRAAERALEPRGLSRRRGDVRPPRGRGRGRAAPAAGAASAFPLSQRGGAHRQSARAGRDAGGHADPAAGRRALSRPRS